MDFLDLLNPAEDYYFTGYYYPTLKSTPDEGRITFQYKQINPYSRAFGTVMNGLRLDRVTYAIKTHEDIDFKNKGYVSTQNGKMWIIEEVIHDEQIPGSEEALRLFKTAVHTEYLIRMVEVDNPWGIGEA